MESSVLTDNYTKKTCKYRNEYKQVQQRAVLTEMEPLYRDAEQL